MLLVQASLSWPLSRLFSVDDVSLSTAETGIEIIHDRSIDQMADLDIFAAQVAAMDVVVTISNTTAHMAGALGVPTFLMLGNLPLWYWMLDRDDCPWYPSLRLFRQEKPGDWGGVIERVCKELERFHD